MLNINIKSGLDEIILGMNQYDLIHILGKPERISRNKIFEFSYHYKNVVYNLNYNLIIRDIIIDLSGLDFINIDNNKYDTYLLDLELSKIDEDFVVIDDHLHYPNINMLLCVKEKILTIY